MARGGGGNNGCFGLLLIAGLVAMLGQCLGGGGGSSDPQALTAGNGAAPVAGVESQGPLSTIGEEAEVSANAGETVYVQPSSLNGRSGPSADAPVVEKLPEGTSLQVVERSGEWMKVAQGATTLWVASRHIGATKPVSLASSVPKKAARKKKRRSGGGASGGYCPCGSGMVCTGPRGGRYCITSGGNKRYGV